MKIFVKVSVVVLLAFTASGQQDPMLTQYMFNGLYLNPAYAGSHEYWSSTLSYRSQWVGATFDGAPQTVIAAVDGPVRGKNIGLGFIASHDRIGVTRTTTFMADYAYQIKLNDKSKLALGLNAGVAQYSSNLTEVLVWDEGDEIYANNQNKVLPRIGFGMYYFSKRYYIGASIPTLLAYEDGNDFSMDLSRGTFLSRHYLFTAGIVLDVSENVKFKPSVLLKYTRNAPVEGDLNFSAVFRDMFWIGATYRTGDAAAILLEYRSNNFFRIGYSYDITFSGLRSYQSGSHEIMIGIDFGKDLIKVKTPRYF